jgi:monofunctional biosynthetic peptidoglycan transglycosylase
MERMRELRKTLKAAGDRLRASVHFPQEPAVFLRQKGEALKERARQWRARQTGAAVPESLDGPPPGGEILEPRPDRLWPAAADSPVAFRLARSEAPADDAALREHKSSRYRLLKAIGLVLLILFALPHVLILVYRFVDPPFSALMARQWLAGVNVRQHWVDFEDISPALPIAVVIAEDAAFCRHWGVDWNAVSEALEEAEDGEPLRGASTIPMQTAKNLFLWNGQNFVRKVLEVPLAYVMSALWPKQRVFEIYLNIAEWGPGIFGAEAAARYHFHKSAAGLNPREAALLAAALPSPKTRVAGRPNGTTTRIAARIGARVAHEAQDVSCVFARGR